MQHHRCNQLDIRKGRFQRGSLGSGRKWFGTVELVVGSMEEFLLWWFLRWQLWWWLWWRCRVRRRREGRRGEGQGRWRQCRGRCILCYAEALWLQRCDRTRELPRRFRSWVSVAIVCPKDEGLIVWGEVEDLELKSLGLGGGYRKESLLVVEEVAATLRVALSVWNKSQQKVQFWDRLLNSMARSSFKLWRIHGQGTEMFHISKWWAPWHFLRLLVQLTD